MNLKQEDRNLLHEFFRSQSDWMKSNDLLTSENLKEFHKRFLDFSKSKACEENLACKLFQFTLEHELLKCEEIKLITEYNADKNVLKKANLNYIPLVQPATNNKSILVWINEANISHTVPASHIAALNKSIDQKLKQNAAERQASYEEVKNFIVN